MVNYLQSFKLKVNKKVPPEKGTLDMSEVIFNKSLRDARDEFEKLYFKFHMQKKLSVSELAKKSGVERTHLYRKLKSLGIKSK